MYCDCDAHDEKHLAGLLPCGLDPMEVLERLLPFAHRGHMHWLGDYTDCERCEVVKYAQLLIERKRFKMEQEAKWAERDRRREEHEALMERLRAEHREEMITIAQRALPREAAEKAVDALLADGVVFARMGAPFTEEDAV